MKNIADVLKNIKLLYVEDEGEHREQLCLFLKRRVGKLITAKNGKEGLQAFLEHTPDIVITDLRMPEMSGVEMSENIRQQDKFCPIIITTAFSDVETILKTVERGIDKYIVKPIDTDELLVALEECVIKVVDRKNTSYLTGADLKEKKGMEDKILKEVSYYVKKNTGKGPRFVKVFMIQNRIEIEIHDPFTTLEKSLLENRRNMNLVSYCRQAFYMDRSKNLQSMVEEITHKKFKLETVETDFKGNKDTLKFVLKV